VAPLCGGGIGRAILQSGSIITLAMTPNTDNRRLSLSLEGPTGLGYTIETSTDLTFWHTLTNISLRGSASWTHASVHYQCLNSFEFPLAQYPTSSAEPSANSVIGHKAICFPDSPWVPKTAPQHNWSHWGTGVSLGLNDADGPGTIARGSSCTRLSVADLIL